MDIVFESSNANTASHVEGELIRRGKRFLLNHHVPGLDFGTARRVVKSMRKDVGFHKFVHNYEHSLKK